MKVLRQFTHFGITTQLEVHENRFFRIMRKQDVNYCLYSSYSIYRIMREYRKLAKSYINKEC